METAVVTTYSQYHDAVMSFGKNVVVFRGVKSTEYELIPKIGRYQLRGMKNDLQKEKYIFKLFKERGLPYVEQNLDSDWEWLALAQHYGLPTRLLDWSRNPLVAAYFAVESKYDNDSVVYAYEDNQMLDTSKYPSPFDVTEVKRFVPKHITERITTQNGIFTIHPHPKMPFNSKKIKRIIIAHAFRVELKAILHKYGIHKASLFPGLDGLAEHLLWLRTNEY